MPRCRMLSVSYVGRSRRQTWPTRSPALPALLGGAAAAKERVGRQRQLIARLAANGHSVRDAESFLSALMNVLSAFECHRLLILKRLDEP